MGGRLFFLFIEVAHMYITGNGPTETKMKHIALAMLYQIIQREIHLVEYERRTVQRYTLNVYLRQY